MSEKEGLLTLVREDEKDGNGVPIEAIAGVFSISHNVKERIERLKGEVFPDIVLRSQTEYAKYAVGQLQKGVEQRVAEVLSVVEDDNRAAVFEKLETWIRGEFVGLKDKIELYEKKQENIQFMRMIRMLEDQVEDLRSHNDTLKEKNEEIEHLASELATLLDEANYALGKAEADKEKLLKRIHALTEKYEASFYDKKTGLLLYERGQERAKFTLTSLFREMQSEPQTFGALYIDIDFFKRINTDYGHHEADKVLKRLGEIVQSVLRRKTDFAVRYGGEELVIYLKNPNHGIMQKMADEVMDKLKAEQFKLERIDTGDKEDCPVTVSIGGYLQYLTNESCAEVAMENGQLLAHDAVESSDLEQTILDEIDRQADILLMDCKENGRNQARIKSSQDDKIESGDLDDVVLK